jgi:hypothetical protein
MPLRKLHMRVITFLLSWGKQLQSLKNSGAFPPLKLARVAPYIPQGYGTDSRSSQSGLTGWGSVAARSWAWTAQGGAL